MRATNAARAPREDTYTQPERIKRERPKLRLAPPPMAPGMRVPFVVMIVFLVIAGVVGILALNQKINENAWKLDRLHAQQAQLDRQEQNLNEEIAVKAAPGNLAAEARKLGLVPAGPPAFIRLPDGRIEGVPQPANGQPAITSQGG
jgi:outer membrane murein-binding lipoprotein Lpp